jgi:hypothetical protein
MGRRAGSSTIKNAPTLNGHAVFLRLLTIALVIVAPIGHDWAQGAKPELITLRAAISRSRASSGSRRDPVHFQRLCGITAAKSCRAPLIPSPIFR